MGSGDDVAEFFAVGDCHSLCLAPNTQLAQDVRDVRPNCFPADEQAFSDVVLAQAIREEQEDLALSVRQPRGDRRYGRLRAPHEMPDAPEQLVRRVGLDDVVVRTYEKSGDWDALYQAKVSAKRRSQDRRRLQQLKERGSVEFSLARSREEVELALADAFRLHTLRWEARGDGSGSRPRRVSASTGRHSERSQTRTSFAS
jgi:hypothetical protein